MFPMRLRLIISLLLIVNYFGWKYYKRFDWTGSQLYSLSEKTVNVLKGLRHDVDFYVFLSPDEQHERVSRPATADSVHVPAVLRPGATGAGPALRYPTWEELSRLTPDERRLVLDYFRRLNVPAAKP